MSPEEIGGAEKVVERNGVTAVPWRAFDDPAVSPNVAVLQFAAPPSAVNVAAVRSDRGIVDVPTLMVRWLGYLWGAEPTKLYDEAAGRGSGRRMSCGSGGAMVRD